jgi:hypothetical protein
MSFFDIRSSASARYFCVAGEFVVSALAVLLRRQAMMQSDADAIMPL